MFAIFKPRKPSPSPGFDPEKFAAIREWSSSRDYLGALPLSPDNIVAYTYARLMPVLHHCRIGKITMKGA